MNAYFVDRYCKNNFFFFFNSSDLTRYVQTVPIGREHPVHRHVGTCHRSRRRRRRRSTRGRRLTDT